MYFLVRLYIIPGLPHTAFVTIWNTSIVHAGVAPYLPSPLWSAAIVSRIFGHAILSNYSAVDGTTACLRGKSRNPEPNKKTRPPPHPSNLHTWDYHSRSLFENCFVVIFQHTASLTSTLKPNTVARTCDMWGHWQYKICLALVNTMRCRTFFPGGAGRRLAYTIWCDQSNNKNTFHALHFCPLMEPRRFASIMKQIESRPILRGGHKLDYYSFPRYMCMYTQIHKHTYTWICECMCILTYVHKYAYIYICIYPGFLLWWDTVASRHRRR